MSFVDAAMAATAQQQKYTPYRARRESSLWLDAASLSACSQFWYDESEYHGYDGSAYLSLPGKDGAYLSKPHSASFNPGANPLDIRASLALDDWSPVTVQSIVTHHDFTTDNRSWNLSVNTNGRLLLYISSTGTNVISYSSSVAVPVSDQGVIAVRALFTSSTSLVFYTKQFTSDLNLADDAGWTQLGSTIAPVTSAFSVTAPLTIGGNISGTATLGGKVYGVRVAVAGAEVAAFDSQTYLENSWTLNGQALNGEYPVIVNQPGVPKYRAMLGANSVAGAGDPKILTNQEPAHVRFTGTNGQAIVKSNANVGVDVTQNFEVTVRAALNDWAANLQGMVSIFGVNANQRAFNIGMSGGTVTTISSNDGVNITSVSLSAVSSYVAPIAGEYMDLRFRFRTIGSLVYVSSQMKSPSAAAWTDLGNGNTTLASLFNSSADLALGCRYYNSNDQSSGNNMSGKIAWVKITQNGVVTDEFDAANPGSEWTLNNVSVTSASSENYLYLPGTTGNNASSPSSSALNITGDLDLIARVKPTTWLTSSAQFIIGKWNTTGNQRAYSLYINATNGRLILATSANGAGAIFSTSTASPSFAAKQAGWVRATIDVDNGASGYDVKFYTSTNGTTWTQLGTTVTGAGTTSIYSSTASLEIGSQTDGASSNFDGYIYRAIVKNGIDGTTVFDADFTNKSGNSFTESSSNAATVTVSRGTTGYFAQIVDRTTLMTDGTDDFVDAAVRSSYVPGTGNFTAFFAGTAAATNGSSERVLSLDNGSGGGWLLRVQGTTFYTIAGDTGGNYATAAVSYTPDYAKTSAALVIDSVAKVLKPWRGAFGTSSSMASVSSVNYSNNLMIARRSSSAANYFRGCYYGVVLMPLALSSGELNAISAGFKV